MQPYLLVFSGLAAGAVYGTLTRRAQNHSVPFLFLASILWLFGAFRYEVGADWLSYESMFNDDANWFDPRQVESEYLFHGLFWALSTLGLSYHETTAVLFTISYIVKLIAIRRLSPAPNLSLVIYYTSVFVFLDVNGVRQGMALGFTLLALDAARDRRFVTFLAWTVAATMVHVSAIVFLPFYWLAHLAPPRWAYVLVAALVLLARPLVESAVLNERLLQVVLTEGQIGKIMYYAHSDNFGRSVQLTDPALIQRIFVFLVVLLLWRRLRLDEKTKRVLFNCYAISFFLFLAMGSFLEIGFRLSYYYKAADLFLLATIAASGRDVFSRNILNAMVLVFALILLWRMLQLPDGGLMPYSNWLL